MLNKRHFNTSDIVTYIWNMIQEVISKIGLRLKIPSTLKRFAGTRAAQTHF